MLCKERSDTFKFTSTPTLVLKVRLPDTAGNTRVFISTLFPFLRLIGISNQSWLLVVLLIEAWTSVVVMRHNREIDLLIVYFRLVSTL